MEKNLAEPGTNREALNDSPKKRAYKRWGVAVFAIGVIITGLYLFRSRSGDAQTSAKKPTLGLWRVGRSRGDREGQKR